MKSQSIKLELIQWLSQMTDQAMLKTLLHFKTIEESNDWADNLTRSQIEEINAGLEDIRKKRTIPSEKVWSKYGRTKKH